MRLFITHKQKFIPILILILTLSLVLSQPAWAASIKLSQAVQPEGGDVADYEISSDGEYVVFRADANTDGTIDLFSVPLAGGIPTQLNQAMPAGASVRGDYQISADGTRVVYRADQGTLGLIELYSVPIAGPASSGVKLNVALIAQGDVNDLAISPNSQRVVYRADAESNESSELYSVPIAGPAASNVKLNLALPSGAGLTQFKISPNSQRVVFMGDMETRNNYELFSVPINGPSSSVVKINATLVTFGDVFNFEISPDSSRVVYIADQIENEVYELFSTPIAGPADAIKLNPTPTVEGDITNYLISPDSSFVVYTGDLALDFIDELYSVAITGPYTDSVLLNKSMVDGGSVVAFDINADGSRVVYRADQDTNDVYELFSVPSAGPGSSSVKLNLPQPAGVYIPSFKISPDGSRVVYHASQEFAGMQELYSVPIAGPASQSVEINGLLIPEGDVFDYTISPDSSRVAYTADQDTDSVYELYSTPITGPSTEASKLSGPGMSGAVLDYVFLFAPDSSRVVYIADQEISSVYELYVSDNGRTAVGFPGPTLALVESATTVQVEVRLNQAAILEVQVDYAAVGGTAIPGIDYSVLAPGTLTFPPGVTSQTIPLTLLDDPFYEAGDTLLLELSSPQNATLATASTLTITISDSDTTRQTFLPLALR